MTYMNPTIFTIGGSIPFPAYDSPLLISRIDNQYVELSSDGMVQMKIRRKFLRDNFGIKTGSISLKGGTMAGVDGN